MKYIDQAAYEYVINKYHDSSKPFDSFNRFIRRDEIFSADSGMAPDDVLAGIEKNDKSIEHLPHAIRKARALEFVLNNTRIACDERDIFPAINMIDRPLSKVLLRKWRREVFCDMLPQVEERRAQLEKSGIVTVWPDYDHSVPMWERLLELGFAGILSASEAARADRELTPDEEAFFDSIKITYEAILSFIERLCAAATSDKMKSALSSIRRGAPKSFYEALLLSYLYFMISEHIDGVQVRSLSNFDRLFLRFYQGDLEKGIDEYELRRELAYYFLQFTAIGNYYNQPLLLGGTTSDEGTVINALSYMLLDVYDEMGIYNPKLQIRVSDSTPKPFIMRALDMIRRGHNCIVFVSDRTIRRALVRSGVSEEAARVCDVTGCYEYSPQGSYTSAMNYFNLLKPLEYALHRGCDGVSGRFSGMSAPELSAYDTFEALWESYKAQLLYAIKLTVDTVNQIEAWLSYVNPLPLLSATFPSCLEKAKDAICGGSCQNDTILDFGFLADTVDSLTMLKKYVYEKRELTLAEMVKALDDNFVGSERLRQKLLNDREKYGNNRQVPDALAVELVNFITENVCGLPNSKKRGGKWNCGFHVARMSYVQGKLTAASANGRRLGEELSKNISASMGQSREGATAAILSATKLDATSFTSDASLDLGLLPSSVNGDDGLEAMYGLLTTFIRRGGHALHVNAFDADTLRAAQAQPEKYRDLQIRVCGWNVLWSNITKEEQESFIRQAEALT